MINLRDHESRLPQYPYGVSHSYGEVDVKRGGSDVDPAGFAHALITARSGVSNLAPHGERPVSVEPHRTGACHLTVDNSKKRGRGRRPQPITQNLEQGKPAAGLLGDVTQRPRPDQV